nr:Gag-Pol polyprotein [Tanacetum cinerariifolium]
MSKKQDCAAMSTTEAEYVALSASCAQVMWMRIQLKDYGFDYNKIPLYCDSLSAIAISCNPVQHSRTKYINVCYHFIKEHVEHDAEHSTVTYTPISSDDGSLDVGSLRVIVLGYDGLPTMPEDPYAYDDVLPTKEHPLPAAVSPTADSPGYITESNLEEDLEEEDDEDPEEDPADYPIDRVDDEEEEESSKDGTDNEEEEEGEDEEEEEHLALVDSVDRLLAIPTPPPSPLTSYLSSLPQIPSLPLPTSPTDVGAPLGYRDAMIWLRAESPSTFHPLPLPPPIVLLRTRASMVMMRAAVPSTYILTPRSKTPPSGTATLLPIPLPISSPPLLLPSTDYRANVPEVTLPPWKRLCIALGPRFKVEECLSAPTARPTGGFRAYYGFVGTLDADIRRDPDKEIGYEITNVWEDPDEILKEIPATDVADQLNLLHRDRRSHARITRLMETHNADRSRNGNDIHNSGTGSRRIERTARECTYTDFLKCQPMKFKGTEGVVGLTQWFERMETVFNINNRATVGQDAAHGMSWNTLMKMMTAKYCPQNEIKKLEMEI